MEQLKQLLIVFSKTYPQLKNVEIELSPNDTTFVGRCLVEVTGDFIMVKKGRIRNVTPRKILITECAFEKDIQELLFIFVHECTHGITSQRERRVKNNYVRIDHSRDFYNNFFELLKIAKEHKFLNQSFNTVEEIMKKDNRQENMSSDLKRFT